MAISRTSKILLIVGGVLIVLFVVGVIAIALIAESMGRPSVDNNSVLVLKLSGTLPDYVPADAMRFAVFVYITKEYIDNACP